MNIYKKNIEWRMRKIAKMNILINGVNTFKLDEVASFIYKQFNGEDDFKKIAEKISAHYEIEFDLAYTDLVEFSEQLLGEKIITLVR